MTGVARMVLLATVLAGRVVVLLRVLHRLAAAAHVSLFSGLRADTAQAAETGTAFVGVIQVGMGVIVVVVMMSIGVTYGTTALVNVLVRVQVVGVWRVHHVVVLHVGTDVSLSELVQDRAGPLRIDGRNLSHHLAIVRVRLVFAGALNSLGRACLLGTAALGVAMVPIFALRSLIRRSQVPVVRPTEACLAVLLIVSDATLLQYISEAGHAIAIVGIQPISSELTHLSVGHLLGFLHLLRV
mmetsp:Transcript_11001/g.16680  ORF Transcript_11001/g.16680 Transcript_11001/m.16680 type:complete len:241 (+) Transcript_11001:638-1360(+)